MAFRLSIALTLGATLALWTQPAPDYTHVFVLERDAEVVATIDATCERCDWGVKGREAVLLTLAVDDQYSQHVPLVRGSGPASYEVMLGSLRAGRHRLTLRRDAARSATDAGPAQVRRVGITPYTADDARAAWLSQAPWLHARPGTVERFSDVPLLMYVEANAGTEGPAPYRFQYTVIFSHEDGGTATDRLMATWGRTTDIEFVYGLPASGESSSSGVIQGEDHKWVPFAGTRNGTHPILWVSTDNNMVADDGPADAVVFAPAPGLVAFANQSREAVMDAAPWTYAVTAGEMAREGRIDPAASAGSGKIPDPRRYVVAEACGEVKDATLALDIGVRGADGQTSWFPTDRGDARFRIARSGCFRAGAVLPEGARAAGVVAVRARAYPRPARGGEAVPPGSASLTRVTRVFMLDQALSPVVAPFTWTGSRPIPLTGAPQMLN
jgi:hypothetical protein